MPAKRGGFLLLRSRNSKEGCRTGTDTGPRVTGLESSAAGLEGRVQRAAPVHVVTSCVSSPSLFNVYRFHGPGVAYTRMFNGSHHCFINF